MEKLKQQRQTIKSSLTRIYNVCAEPSATSNEIQVRVHRAEQLFNQFEHVQEEIESLVPEQQEQEEAYRNAMEEKYFAIKAIHARLVEEEANHTVVENSQFPGEWSTAMRALMEHQGTMGALIERISNNTFPARSPTNVNETGNTVTQSNVQHELRLPQIQVPDFDGTATEWIRFRDLFETLIHNRSNISEVEKLEYLQTKMKGEALSLIKHLKPTNANYEVAWQLLKKKYDRSDKVKKAYFELLFEQPPLRVSSVADMKRFYNSINESVNALKVLEEPVQHWDSILIFMLEKKLDSDTHSLWYREKTVDKAATFQELLDFLERRVYALENAQKSSGHAASQCPNNKRSQAHTFAAVVQTCSLCAKDHSLYFCPQFKEMNVANRHKHAQRNNICFNCLQPNHRVADCKSSSCRKCGAKHNTLLHLPTFEVEQKQGDELQAADNQGTYATMNSSKPSQKQIRLLPTAIVLVQDGYNVFQPCRALLDSGSQGSLISEACMQRLRLKRMFDKTILYGVNSINGTCTRGKVELHIASVAGEFTTNTEALCLHELTQNLPSWELPAKSVEFFKHIEFADPNFGKPGKIDIILGADVFIDCVLPGKLTHPSGSPSALHTTFGWVIMGKATSSGNDHLTIAHTCIEVGKQLQQFWEIEDLQQPAQYFTPDEKKAEEHFAEHVRRDDSGRYMVRMPLKYGKLDLGESRMAAAKRLSAMERRFNNDSPLRAKYTEFMREYSDLGHMEPSANVESNNVYFLPHHAVLKPTSTTTKLRVVFDASCKTSNGRSLNDQLLIGPTLQRDLFDIVLSFRKYRVGFTGDIEKMYRQVLVHPKDRPLQRILWREAGGQIKEYDLCTLTYGTASAPFLAIRTLQQVAHDNRNEYPSAAAAILQNLYVDDFMGCADNESDSIQLKNEICAILSKAGFHLRKWASNSNSFMDSIDHEDREVAIDAIIDTTQTVKTLGLLWDTSSDSFKYNVTLAVNKKQPITKRGVLSDIARIFDPIGWLSPIVISMKILMQRLWLRGVGWDDELPEDLYNQWIEYLTNINDIAKLRIPRWFNYSNEGNIELHGFADSSELAYAAAIYLRVQSENGEIFTNLIAAKTRVTPVKQITLPRLELCAAHLMAKLITKVRAALELPHVQLFGWTDSSVVLAWISDHPRRWKTFIANRTTQIIEVVPAEQWRHIPSQHNPADMATRGVVPSGLLNNALWWCGPDELRQPTLQCDRHSPVPKGVDLEERNIIVSHNATVTDVDIIDRYSDYSRLLRITALILRFAQNCKIKKANLKQTDSFLSTSELHAAHTVLIRKAQLAVYSSEIKALSSGKQLPASHKLISLTPFIGDDGLLRVGGRVTHVNR